MSTRIDTSGALAKFKRIEVNLQNELLTAMPRVGRLVAVQLAQKTQPIGFAVASKKKGEDAIARDIRRVFATPSDVWATIADKNIANAFLKAIRANKIELAYRIKEEHSSVFKGVPILDRAVPQLHMEARVQGKVPKNQRPVLIVRTTGALRQYIAEKKKMAGFLKAGWAACAAQLGGTAGIPEWVVRHLSAVKARTVVDVRNREQPRVVLVNQISYAGAEIDAATRREALAEGQRRFFESVARAYRAAARKAGI